MPTEVSLWFDSTPERDRFLAGLQRKCDPKTDANVDSVPGFWTLVPGVSVGVFCDRVTLYLRGVDRAQVSAVPTPEAVKAHVVALLKAQGFPASHEYPDIICIGPWTFGTANEQWSGDADDGARYAKTPIPSESTDAQAIADAIATALRKDLQRALDALRHAARDLRQTWDVHPGDAVDGYPAAWPDFDEVDHQLAGMRVKTG